MEQRRRETTTEHSRTSPVQPRQRQKLLPRPSHMENHSSPGLGADPQPRTTSVGREHHQSSLGCPNPTQSMSQRPEEHQCRECSITAPNKKDNGSVVTHINRGPTHGLSALPVETSPLAPYKIQRQAKVRVQEKIST